ncbi:MAG: tetratricopeptide repeat protein, partial [Candidatus Sumerlaeota bacterium]|nr:tetratricopeptide repeat protein [Candidatus Sumerlaeota bacterium]
ASCWAQPFEVREAWRKQLDLAVVNEPLARDLFFDDEPEIILSDNEGRLVMIEAQSGRTIWSSARRAGVSFSAPIAGNFLSPGAPDILVAGSDGKLYLFSSVDGRLRARAPIGVQITLPPSLIPLSKGGLVQPRFEGQDGVVLVDNSGGIHCIQFEGETKAVPIWENRAGMQIKSSAAVGTLREPGRYDVVVGRYDGKVCVYDGQTGAEWAHYTLPAGRSIEAGLALGQMAGSANLDEILAGDNRGYLHALRVPDRPGDEELVPIWDNPVSILGNPLGVLATVDVNQDQISDIISVYVQDLVVVDGLRGEMLQWSARDRVAAPPALVHADDGNVYAFVVDASAVLYVVQLGTRALATRAEFHDQGAYGRNPMAIAVGPDHRVLLFAVQSEGGKALALQTPLTCSSDRVPWGAFGGTSLRSGSKGASYYDRLEASQERRQSLIAKDLEEARAALNKEEWSKARDLAEEILGLDPLHKEARQILRRARLHAQMWLYVLLAVALAAAGWFGGRPAQRVLAKEMGLTRADKARQAGQLDRAEQIYRRLNKLFPDDKNVNAQLAILYMKQGNFSEAALPVFERVYRRSPDNPAVVQALARAYLNAQRRDDKALETYLKASDQFDEPGPLNHALGAAYFERGDAKKALSYLRKAFRDDYQPQELFLLMADVYLELGVRSSSAIRIYETAYAARPLDDRLLLALAEAYVAAGRTDPAAEEVCEKLLETRPDHDGARLLVAHIQLRKGGCDEAIRHAQRVLQGAPDNAEAIDVLARGYLAAERVDDDALKVMDQALAHTPEDRALLTACARIRVERGALDAAGVDLVKRAFAAAPEDTVFQRAVCAIAGETGENDLLIDAAQRLVDSNQAAPDIWKSLASAYCARHDQSAKAERAYREALAGDSENLDWLAALGAIYASQGRTDSEALHVFVRMRGAGRLDPDTGAQLVRALQENGQIDEAVARANELLERFPGNAAIQRLLAKASLESNRIDEAIAEYERILATVPDDREAALQLATAYARKHRLDPQAEGLYARAQELDPANCVFSVMRARVMIENEDWPAAAETLKDTARQSRTAAETVRKEVLRIVRDHPEALQIHWLGFQLAHGLGRRKEALEDLAAIFAKASQTAPRALEAVDQILAQGSDEGQAHLLRGKILRSLGRLEDARPALEQARVLQPNDRNVQSELVNVYTQMLQGQIEPRKESEILFSLGSLYQQLRLYDKAIQCFQSTAQDFRFEADSARHLGQCFVARGMLDLALQEFKKLFVDDEVKELLYDLGQRYEQKSDLAGAKTVYRQLFAADIAYRDVKEKFEMLSGATSDPQVFEKTRILNSLSEAAKQRYELLEEIGRGAMGIVYRARDNELQETVALKILPDNLSNNPEAVRRFKAEARSARRLSHPHIVRIHDIGEEMGRKYISMEFVEGSDLKRRLRADGPVPYPQLIDYAEQICSALAYAHTVGIVHRDVKPANIMVTKDGQIKITDFGIAKIAESTESTLAGAVIGTPLYMSPEQVQGATADSRADI